MAPSSNTKSELTVLSFLYFQLKLKECAMLDQTSRYVRLNFPRAKPLPTRQR
jgi:hypothetical protein